MDYSKIKLLFIYSFIYLCFSTDQKFVVRKAISKPRSYPRHQVDLHIFSFRIATNIFVLWNQWHSYDNSQWHVESVRASLTKAIAFSSFVSASLLSELAVQHEDTEVWRCSKLEGQDLNSLKYIVHMVIQKDVWFMSHCRTECFTLKIQNSFKKY